MNNVDELESLFAQPLKCLVQDSRACKHSRMKRRLVALRVSAEIICKGEDGRVCRYLNRKMLLKQFFSSCKLN